MAARMHILIGLVLALALAPTGTMRAAEPRGAKPLQITLLPEVQIGDRMVRIGDVARIAGADPTTRSHVARLDLVKMDEDESTAHITRALVEARLLISGAAPRSVRVDGAEATQVTCFATETAEQRALRAVRAAVAEQSLAPEEDVVVQLAQPLTADAMERITATSQDELEARFSDGETAGGRERVALWTSDGRGARRETPIVVDIRFRERVPVATRALGARHTLAAGDLRFEPRALTRRGSGLTFEQAIGKSLRRAVAAGDVIADRDLIAPVAAGEPVVIRPRDVVRVTVQKGTLMLVMPDAEAVQAGRHGEMIRVRNPKSGRIVLGRVTGPGEVEVPL